MPATVELAAITVDCQDPGPIAAFYQAATGGESVRSGADSARVKIAGILWIFRRVEDYRPPIWPSAADAPGVLRRRPHRGRGRTDRSRRHDG